MAQRDYVKAPLFLVAAERSGTTLLRSMLDHHPDVTWQNEFEFAVNLMSDQGQWPALETFYEFLSTHRVFQTNDFTIDINLDYGALVNSFLVQRMEQSEKNIIGATVHRHFNRLLTLWPDARFIHLLRDGRDVARSNIGMGWAANMWCGAARWIEAETLWEEVRGRLSEANVIEVSSEKLIASPVETLTAICQFIGVAYHSKMLSYPEDTTYQAPDPTLSYQWKKKLSDDDIRLAEARIGAMLEARGYPLSGLEPMEVSSKRQATLRRQDRIGRFLFRARRYGWILILQDALARRIGPRWWEKRIRHRINEKAQPFIK